MEQRRRRWGWLVAVVYVASDRATFPLVRGRSSLSLLRPSPDCNLVTIVDSLCRLDHWSTEVKSGEKGCGRGKGTLLTSKHETTLWSANAILSEICSLEGEWQSRYCVFPPLATFDFVRNRPLRADHPPKSPTSAAGLRACLAYQSSKVDSRIRERVSERVRGWMVLNGPV